jgi:ribonuclease HI
MIKIYSDASLSKFGSYKAGGWCTIIVFQDKKIALYGGCISKDTNTNDLELKASLKGISFALETLKVNPKELLIFIDNPDAYKQLKRNEKILNARIKFIGGEKINNIYHIDRQLYNACHNISGKLAYILKEKMKKERRTYEIKEERAGFVKVVRNISKFVEREIQPIIIEKARKEPEKVADFDKLLEECIDEYIKIKKITAVIRITDTDGQTYLTAQELSQAVKKKTKNKIKREILKI